MYIYFALVLFLPMLALRKRRVGDAQILDARSTTCIKGIICLYVMLHNLGLDLPENSEFKELVCEHAGGVGVGIFFFLSAFGIVRSYQAKGNKYLTKILLVNIPKLYIISVLINLLIYFAFFEGAFETRDMWMRIFNLDLFNDFKRMNRHGWFIMAIITLYVFFVIIYFICSKLKTDKKMIIAGILLALVAVGLRLTAHIIDKGGMYTREMPAFAIGCIYATFYDKINSLASKYFVPALLVSIIAFIFGYLGWEPLATYASALIIILVSQKFTYYSDTTFFLGKICIGMYLFLYYTSLVFANYFLNDEYMWILTNAGLMLLLSIGLYAAERSVFFIIKKAKALFRKSSVSNGSEAKINS